ncbi:MAG: hypothetical protein AAF720_01860 [Pseudomonadota bacterium]
MSEIIVVKRSGNPPIRFRGALVFEKSYGEKGRNVLRLFESKTKRIIIQIITAHNDQSVSFAASFRNKIEASLFLEEPDYSKIVRLFDGQTKKDKTAISSAETVLARVNEKQNYLRWMRQLQIVTSDIIDLLLDDNAAIKSV